MSFIFELPEFVAIESWVQSVSPSSQEEVEWDYSQREESRSKSLALAEKVKPNIGKKFQLPGRLGELVLTDTNDTCYKPGNPVFSIWSPDKSEYFKSLCGGSLWEKIRTNLAEKVALETNQALSICLRQCTGVDADEESDGAFVPNKPGIHRLSHFGAVSPDTRWLVIAESLDKAFLADSEGEAYDIWLGRTIPDEEDWSVLDDQCFEF